MQVSTIANLLILLASVQGLRHPPLPNAMIQKVGENFYILEKGLVRTPPAIAEKAKREDYLTTITSTVISTITDCSTVFVTEGQATDAPTQPEEDGSQQQGSEEVVEEEAAQQETGEEEGAQQEQDTGASEEQAAIVEDLDSGVGRISTSAIGLFGAFIVAVAFM